MAFVNFVIYIRWFVVNIITHDAAVREEESRYLLDTPKTPGVRHTGRLKLLSK